MLPVDFINLMRGQLGDEADALFESLSKKPSVSIRLNDKIDILPLESDVEDVPWNEDGYYLVDRPNFTLDPLFHNGCYYVQEAASMFLINILQQYVAKDSVVLDVCAAPGGKATLISQYLGGDGILFANEVNRNRVFALSENIQKWGEGNTIVTHNQPNIFGDRCRNLFDCIVVDAPCSGEGMFRKDATTIKEWSLRNVKMCSDRQRTIIMNVWNSLKPGGILIYSTCTFNYFENEDVVKWICDCLGADPLEVKHDKRWGIVSGGVGYHFYPHRTHSEGFYICAVRKESRVYDSFDIYSHDMHSINNKSYNDTMLTWLKHPDRWTIHQNERFMTAYPKKFKSLIECVYSFLICISFGVGIGEERGKFICPQHSLSMLKDFLPDSFLKVELSYEQAISYLRCESVHPQVNKLGVILFTYNNIPIGFGKNIGYRINNLYPGEWRIRNF